MHTGRSQPLGQCSKWVGCCTKEPCSLSCVMFCGNLSPGSVHCTVCNFEFCAWSCTIGQAAVCEQHSFVASILGHILFCKNVCTNVQSMSATSCALVLSSYLCAQVFVTVVWSCRVSLGRQRPVYKDGLVLNQM